MLPSYCTLAVVDEPMLPPAAAGFRGWSGGSPLNGGRRHPSGNTPRPGNENRFFVLDGGIKPGSSPGVEAGGNETFSRQLTEGGASSKFPGFPGLTGNLLPSGLGLVGEDHPATVFCPVGIPRSHEF